MGPAHANTPEGAPEVKGMNEEQKAALLGYFVEGIDVKTNRRRLTQYHSRPKSGYEVTSDDVILKLASSMKYGCFDGGDANLQTRTVNNIRDHLRSLHAERDEAHTKVSQMWGEIKALCAKWNIQDPSLQEEAEAGQAEAGEAEAGQAEAGQAEAGQAEAGQAEAGQAEAGEAEARDAKPGQAEAE